MNFARHRILVSLVLVLAAGARAGDVQLAGPAFEVTYPASAFAGPFTGSVVVYFAKPDTRGAEEPRRGPNWFAPDPIVSARFHDVAPGAAMRLSRENWVAFPREIPSGEYVVQAVIDRNLGGRAIGRAPGNLFSAATKVTFDPNVAKTIALTCDRVVEEPAFVETARVKECRVESKLLSAFYGRPTFVRGAVALPEEWAADSQRRFPVYYSVPGFGGTHQGLSGVESPRGTSRAGEPFVCVTLDPSCPGGHCVFADSANNGPWGEALVTEFIPECERRFRAIGEPRARFVGGHSSGGWSSLWLQVAYPDVFGGCWSTSPDPVDFRDFQGIDLYAKGENMFVDANGSERPLARRNGEVMIRYRAFSDMERPLRGEQLGSFEWVFSPRGEDGAPLPLWNRDTGAIDASVAEAWKPYDIGLTLRTRWNELAPTLAGKIHVYMGTEDTFYLDGAVRTLKADLEAIHAEAVVEMFPGDHGSVMTKDLMARIDAEMAAQLKNPPRRKPIGTRVVNVAVVIYDPVIEAESGQKLSRLFRWSDPDLLSKKLADDVRVASGGFIDYRIVLRVEKDACPPFVSGFRDDDAGIVQSIRTQKWRENDRSSYAAIFAECGIEDAVRSKDVSEVWLWGAPGFHWDEYAMFIPDRDRRLPKTDNPWFYRPYDVPDYGRTLWVMGFNYERGEGEMLESYGHRAEGILSLAIAGGTWDTKRDDPWNTFTRVDKDHPGESHVGSVHWAPNSESDYDWGNTRFVETHALDWRRYPEMTGQKEIMNCFDGWGPDIVAHHRWWLGMLPKASGETRGRSNNWWTYVADFDRSGL